MWGLKGTRELIVTQITCEGVVSSRAAHVTQCLPITESCQVSAVLFDLKSHPVTVTDVSKDRKRAFWWQLAR